MSFGLFYGETANVSGQSKAVYFVLSKIKKDCKTLHFSPVMIQMKTTSMDIEIERSSAEVKRPQ